MQMYPQRKFIVAAMPGVIDDMEPQGAYLGVWNIDDSGRTCASMVVGRTFLPFRCQFWFKYKQDYFIADSDSDRNARVLRRTVKQ
jgi:hypothetical protein